MESDNDPNIIALRGLAAAVYRLRDEDPRFERIAKAIYGILLDDSNDVCFWGDPGLAKL